MRCGCCTAVHLHILHLGGVDLLGPPDPRNVKLQQCDASQSLERKLRKFSGRSIAVRLLIIQSSSRRRMTSPQLLDTFYGFPRTGRLSCSLITDSRKIGNDRESEANR